ncbi:MAG: hypothetical protein V2B18_03675 [Pseudomonadota bacterium]
MVAPTMAAVERATFPYKATVKVTIHLRGENSNLNVAQAFQPANFLSAISAGWKACPTRENGDTVKGDFRGSSRIMNGWKIVRSMMLVPEFCGKAGPAEPR